MPSSISSDVLILLIFLRVATLGCGYLLLVRSLITFDVSVPETLTIAIPEIPGPVDSAYIVIHLVYLKSLIIKLPK